MRTRLLVVNVGSSPKADIASRHVSPPLRAITASYVGSSPGRISRSIGLQRSAQASASRRLSVIAYISECPLCARSGLMHRSIRPTACGLYSISPSARASSADGTMMPSAQVALRYLAARQAAALFLIAPMIAVSIAPPAPPAIACETMPPMLRLPDCAAAVIAGSNNVTI